MNALKSWFAKSTSSDHTRAERRQTQGLEAIHYIGSDSQQDRVKDISSTGVYLLTERRWPEGSVIPLTLKSAYHPESDLQVSIEAKAVRWGADGMGLSFLLPPGMNLRLWKSSLEYSAVQTEPEEILKEFRVAKALAFLHRVCPAARQDVNLLFREGLSNIRVAGTVEIANQAEDMLVSESNSNHVTAAANIMVRILNDGSWAETHLEQSLWAGLLATSCTLDGTDQTNLHYIEILSQFAAIHARILDAACNRATKVVSASGVVSALPLSCTADELIQISGAHDLVKIDRNLLQLSDLALIAVREKSKFFSYTEEANITPTSIGLELFARCNGHRGAAREFYGLETAASSSPFHQ